MLIEFFYIEISLKNMMITFTCKYDDYIYMYSKCDYAAGE